MAPMCKILFIACAFCFLSTTYSTSYDTTCPDSLVMRPSYEAYKHLRRDDKRAENAFNFAKRHMTQSVRKSIKGYLAVVLDEAAISEDKYTKKTKVSMLALYSREDDLLAYCCALVVGNTYGPPNYKVLNIECIDTS